MLTLTLLVVGCAATSADPARSVTGPFFGVKAGLTPQLLASELLASPIAEYNGTFSPDGTEFFYTSNPLTHAFIVFTVLEKDDRWSQPVIAPFSGQFSDYDPIFSPDGSKLYFSSRRPMPGTPAPNTVERAESKSHIWFVERTPKGWSLPKPALTSDKDEYYNSVTKDGTIYYNVWSEGDIYRAHPTPTGYRIEKLDAVINSDKGEGDPFISPDGDYMIFRGYREDSLGQGDLYISFYIESRWTEPENLGAPINSEANEMCPYVTTDGRLFIFASGRLLNRYEGQPLQSLEPIQKKHQTFDNGSENIYFMSAEFISKLKEKHIRIDGKTGRE